MIAILRKGGVSVVTRKIDTLSVRRALRPLAAIALLALSGIGLTGCVVYPSGYYARPGYAYAAPAPRYYYGGGGGYYWR
jgi:hypothetical protein